MLIAIVGELGRGKTLTLTYLLLKHKVQEKAKIYTNYKVVFADKILKFPTELLDISNGYVGLDEGWVWVNARSSSGYRNKIISHILLSSRKRNLTIYFTSQALKQIDAFIRRVLDLIIVPTYINPEKCYIEYYTPEMELIKRIKFRPKPIFKLYDTTEIINPIKPQELLKLLQNDKEVLECIKNNPTEFCIEVVVQKYATNKNLAKTLIKILKKKISRGYEI